MEGDLGSDFFSSVLVSRPTALGDALARSLFQFVSDNNRFSKAAGK